MKRLMSLILVLALGLIGLYAFTITIGTGTDAVLFFPICTSCVYNYTQQIYTSSQINHQGEITKLRFYHYNGSSLSNSHDWVIYLGHTNRASFASTTDWEPVANLTQVFSGSVLNNFPDPGRWMEITLDTAFSYNNTDNLLVAIHENTPGNDAIVVWKGFPSGDNSGLYCFSSSTNPDVNNPPQANDTISQLASIQLVFPDTEVPPAPELVYPADNFTLTNGQKLKWISTADSVDVSGYDVYIDGTLVSNNQTDTHYTLSDLEFGLHTWYVVALNNVGASAPSESRSFSVVPGVMIGDETQNSGLPIAPHSVYNYTQSIFLQSQINTGNQRIESISYYWNGEGAGYNSSDWVIYLGHTQRTHFTGSADWVPVSEMVQVFAGQVHIPASPGWIDILLDNPFVYNNTDNLVIAVDENTPGNNGYIQYFYSTTTRGRSSSIRSDNDIANPDPNTPPTGTLVAAYPNILLSFGEIPTNPILRISPTAINCGGITHGGSSTPVNLRASNVGSGILNLSTADISIIGPNAAEFSFNPVNLPAALEPGQFVYIPVSASGFNPGEISATLRIVYGGQNHDVALTANILPADVIMIGSGIEAQRQPFGTAYGYERSATLYTASQIGAAGFIDLIGWDCAGASNTVIPYKIWAKNTTTITMSANTWQGLTADMMLLKEGTFTPNTLGWNTFSLDLPFAYTGGSLIIAVESNFGESGSDSGHGFRFTTGSARRHQIWQQNESEPTNFGTLNYSLPNILLHLNQDIQNDLSAVSITGNITPTAGQETSYTVRVRNNGSSSQNNYQVKLMGLDNTILAAVDGPPLNSGMTADIVLAWTPNTSGQISIYGKVEMDGDELAYNNQTATLQLNVQAAGINAITIGAGNELARFPMDFWFCTSIYETLYLADELGFTAGTINSMCLYNHFSTVVDNGATQIYLGSTDQTDLSSGFIPASQLTLVYDGNIAYPTGENTIQINFQTPFMHLSGNLVLMFVRPMDLTCYSSTNLFRCQTAGMFRARYSFNDNSSIDPFNPPIGSYTGQFPQATFFYSSQVIENDLGVANISGNYTPSAGAVSSYTLRVSNNGTQAQTDYTLKLMGLGDVVLASLTGPTIGGLQSLEVEIPWIPTTAGLTSIYGKVELDGDEISTNNQTRPLQISVQPEGINAITIGLGNEISRYPMDFGFRNSLHETLYLADELGFQNVSITSLALYNRFSRAVPNSATKIYLGSTSQTDLSSGFIPADELTLVFDGDIDYPAGENSIRIILQIPYMYTGGNLVMLFVRPMDTQQHSTTNYFRSQTLGTSRCRHVSSNNTILDPYNPPEGFSTGQFPRITFFHTAQLIENDLAALSITGDNNPVLGTTSTYTIRIRNNGTAAQDTYTVKLMGPQNVILGSVAGPPVSSQQSVEVELTWTPTAIGVVSVYGKVELDGDEISNNDRTPNLNIMVDPVDVVTLTVGEGSQNGCVPVNMNWRYSLFQTLYYPDELDGFAGRITGIRFYSNFYNNLPNMPVSIWLGTNPQTNLDDGYIPSTELTLVYQGPVDFPRGENTIFISFNQPYLYLGGENLVMMVYKASEIEFAGTDYFKCQTLGTNRSRNAVSSSHDLDPTLPPDGTLSGQFPQTTFMVIPGRVGHISGLVMDANEQPLSGAVVSLNHGEYSTTTDAGGRYQLINIWPNTYTLSFNAIGHYEYTQTIVLEQAAELTINATLTPFPQVSVTGVILANDTSAPISGALIRLSGYESYQANTDAEGIFTIPGVFADHTYEYNITAAGYYPLNGEVAIGSIDHHLGEIALHEILYAPMNVTAVVNDAGDAVNLTWQAPNSEAQEVVESFEGTNFPPDNWTQTITNHGPANPLGIYPTWCRFDELVFSGGLVAPTAGVYQVGLFWDNNQQDEWLITPAFNCPLNSCLSFDSYVFLGSTAGDHYYVQVSADNGITWNVLWDASAQTGGWNRYASPITIDLSDYVGEQLKIAFRAIGTDGNTGLSYPWFIDNICIGAGTAALRFTSDDLTTLSASHQLLTTSPLRAASPNIQAGNKRFESRLLRPSQSSPGRRTSRMLTGYMVYRFQALQEHDQDAWVAVTDIPITELNFSDPDWASLPDGNYRWAIRAFYTGNLASVPSFSNVMPKEIQMGLIVGVVKNKNNIGISGATVSNGTQSTTTTSMGAYMLTVPVGYHSLTASAADYNSQTVEGVLVEHNLATTVNFTLDQTSSAENHLPVVATALNGNYPNPFNPETTISYCVKEPGPVKLEIYNIKGQLVHTLLDEELSTGHYKLIFNAKDGKGRAVASGVYLIRMTAPGYQKTSKMILMR